MAISLNTAFYSQYQRDSVQCAFLFNGCFASMSRIPMFVANVTFLQFFTNFLIPIVMPFLLHSLFLFYSSNSSVPLPLHCISLLISLSIPLLSDCCYNQQTLFTITSVNYNCEQHRKKLN